MSFTEDEKSFFEFTGYGELDGKEVLMMFETRETYEKYCEDSFLLEDLNFGLQPSSGPSKFFYFSSEESKQRWISENIKLLKKFDPSDIKKN